MAFVSHRMQLGNAFMCITVETGDKNILETI